MREIHGMYRISLDEVSLERLDELKASLTIVSSVSDTFGFSDPVRLECWRDGDGYIEVPREFGRRFFGPASDCMVRTDPVDFTFSGTLRDKQVPVVNSVLERGEPSGIIRMPCGTGKTVVALKLLSHWRQRAVVLVHKGFLVRQWKNRIHEFLGIPMDDIGHVQQDTTDFDHPITICMIQSLVGEREYTPEFYNHFGVVISDEVHRISAPKWRFAIEKFPAAIRLGLSATPWRGDGLDDVFKWHMGNIMASAKGQEMKPDIYRIKVKTVVPNARRYRIGKGEKQKLNLSKLVTDLSTMKHRTAKIAKYLVQALAKGRKILLLTHRVAHIDEIEEEVKYQWERTQNTPIPSMGRYIGGMKEDALEESEGCDLINATFQMAKEALDIPAVDVLALATPAGDVTQAVGRTTRWCDEKKKPIVLDFVDRIETLPELNFLSDKRLRIYTTLKCDFPKNKDKEKEKCQKTG